jgi:hypothetical protein
MSAPVRPIRRWRALASASLASLPPPVRRQKPCICPAGENASASKPGDDGGHITGGSSM